MNTQQTIKQMLDLQRKGYDDALEGRAYKNPSDSKAYVEGYEEGSEMKVRWAKEELKEFRAKHNPRPPRKPKKAYDNEAFRRLPQAIPDVDYGSKD